MENLIVFQHVFNSVYFSTKSLKIPEKQQKNVENFVKNEISTFSTVPIKTTKINILFDFC